MKIIRDPFETSADSRGGERLPPGQRSGCVFCGKPLLYLDQAEEARCLFCHRLFMTQAKCVDNHFVCDTCHSSPANDLIERFTIMSTSTDAIPSATLLMKSPAVKIHGPEHHFLVPAVLVSAFRNAGGRADQKEADIRKARERAEKVPGGFCGFFGDCGAAVGTGIFISVVTGATPLSVQEWRLANMMTARSLSVIADAGGPRCCKRNTYLALKEAITFAREHLGVEMGVDQAATRCVFYGPNRECKKRECSFYPL